MHHREIVVRDDSNLNASHIWRSISQNQDMLTIMRKLDKSLKAGADRILTEQEVSYCYQQMKDQSLKEQLGLEETELLIQRAWNTLRELMNALLLDRDFLILEESASRK